MTHENTSFFSSLKILLAGFFLFLFFASPAKAQIDPRTKTMLVMSSYGAAGGALLGTASMAFGTKPRAIAIGASLGLYAGIVFGSYIVVSHRMQQEKRMNPELYEESERASPYENAGGWSDWFGSGGRYWENPRDLSEAIREDSSYDKFIKWGGGRVEGVPPLFVPLFSLQF